MSRILVKGGCVLTMDQRRGNHPLADVLVEEGRVAEIGPGLRARDAEVVDASEAVVMPGFVDGHRHVWESLFRGAGDLADTPVPAARIGPHHSAGDLYAATLIGLLGAAEAGITTVVDWCDVVVEPAQLEAVLSAHADSGLRTVLVLARPVWAESSAPAPPEQAPSPLLSFAAAPGDPSPGRLDEVAAAWSRARDSGRRIHAHVGLEPGERGVLAELGRRGLLGPDVTLVHATRVDGEGFAAVVSSGASVVLAPASEMTRGLGSPPVQELIDRGIRPGLGVDSELVAPGDLFAQMRAVISIQHATSFDLKLAGKGGVPNLLTTREVIRYGTVDGAAAVGLAVATGSLEPGKQADLVVLRTDTVNIFPINDPIGAVVWGMDTSNLDWVLVGGRPVMREGRLVADLDRARELATAARERVGSAAGLLVGGAA